MKQRNYVAGELLYVSLDLTGAFLVESVTGADGALIDDISQLAVTIDPETTPRGCHGAVRVRHLNVERGLVDEFSAVSPVRLSVRRD